MGSKKAIRRLEQDALPTITDYPMHYFAFIQRQNQINLSNVLRRHEITPQMWRILLALNDQNGRTIGDIADLTVMDRSNLGRLLEEMVESGLVAQTRSEQDRRIILTQITPAGLRKYTTAASLVSEMYSRLSDGIESAELETLMRILKRMKRNALDAGRV